MNQNHRGKPQHAKDTETPGMNAYRTTPRRAVTTADGKTVAYEDTYASRVIASSAGGGSNGTCNNCGKYGHTFHQCKMPITSFGVIIFRINPEHGLREYLMIRRKDTLGYVDFLRGKYQVRENGVNRRYLLNMFKQMTRREKERIRTLPFDVLWNELWNPPTSTPITPPANPSNTGNVTGFTQTSKYRHEETVSGEKFEKMRSAATKDSEETPSVLVSPNCKLPTTKDHTLLASIIDDSDLFDTFEEAEWGFPKGRRNYQERDYDCAIREMVEETGFPMRYMKNIKNLMPFEEIFLGSNYKSYKHKYYLMYIPYEYSIQRNMDNYERAEVSCMQWKTFDNCLRSIRPYNIEKKRLLYHIESCLNRYQLLMIE
jgi:8-oxo-dGTP pyrophosphatase MutT (NUDIX family)